MSIGTAVEKCLHMTYMTLDLNNLLEDLMQLKKWKQRQFQIDIFSMLSKLQLLNTE